MVWAWEGPNDVLGSPPALTVPLVDLGHQSRAEQSRAVPSVLIPGGIHTDDPLARLACVGTAGGLCLPECSCGPGRGC